VTPDIKTVEMPPRSRLYNLPMAGKCGATQESLLSYSQRLSATHHVPARQMMAELLLPESSLSSLVTQQDGRSLINPKNLLSLNGAADGAATFAAGMMNLTGNPALANGTFLHWRGLLSSRMTMAPSRRWCPHCLANQSDRDQVTYALLWSVKVVDACPIHKVLLLDRCARCERPQPILGDGPTHGCCQHCLARLGSDVQCDTAHPAPPRQQFMAESAAEMIGLGPSARNIANRERFHEQLRLIAETQIGGSVRTLERRLQLSAGIVSKGGAIGLPVLLDLAYCLDLKPVVMLKGGTQQGMRAHAQKSQRKAQIRMPASRIHEFKLEVDRLVQVLIKAAASRIVIADLARRFQVLPKALYAHCADSIALIQDYNTHARPRLQAEQLEQLERAAKGAMRRLVAEGGIVTKRKVNQALVDVGVHWSRAEVRAAANQELTHLLQRAA